MCLAAKYNKLVEKLILMSSVSCKGFVVPSLLDKNDKTKKVSLEEARKYFA